MKTKVLIGSDHGAFDLKENLIKSLSDSYEFINVGCYFKESTDYPIYAKAVCEGIKRGDATFGILLCTTGIGMSICANKFEGIRAGLCTSKEMAFLTRSHNDANVLCLGAINQTGEEALEIAKTFLATEFSALEKHQRRINLISECENDGR